MQPLRATVFVLLLCCAASLPALVSEDTAATSALSGITQISDSVGACLLSPLIPVSGISFSSQIPFGMADCAVYTLNAASAIQPVRVNFGASILDQGDYRWQDLRLGAAASLRDFSFGVAGHLILESFSSGKSYQRWSPDCAVGWNQAPWSAELRCLRLGADDGQYQLGASYQITPDLTTAAAYALLPGGKDTVRVASVCRIGKLVRLQCSWQNAPARFGAGASLRLGITDIAYSIRTHPDLNLTHSLDLCLYW